MDPPIKPQENPGDTLPLPLSVSKTIDFKQPDSLVGQILESRFLIEKNLADEGADAGGIGIVYLAKDMKLMGKEVVVKILNERALNHPDIVRKFEHEKEALIRLDHPGIVRILDSGNLSDGNPFMVMDFIKGYSLRHAMQLSGRLPLGLAATVIEAMTDALSAAHTKKILHRDIKPENVMLSPLEEGLYRVRLIDFGIARVGDPKLAPATEISRAIGSVLYIAPEQLIGKLDLTPAADIYATAIVAYEMITGELPFKPESVAEMYQLEREGVKTPPSQLRPEMPRMAESILLSALEFEAEKRPQNARAFGRFLAHELRIEANETDRYFASVKTEFSRASTEVMPAPDPSDFTTVRRPAGKLRESSPLPVVKWSAGALAALLILAFGGYVGWKYSGSPEPAMQPAIESPYVEPAEKRELIYFLNVQRRRFNKDFKEPFIASGNEIFESGWKFTMNFQVDSAGYLYVLSENRDVPDRITYNLLFPTQSVNNGTAQVDPGRSIATLSNTFRNVPGTEVLWVIWTASNRDDLESVARAARSAVYQAVENEADLERLRNFFDENKEAIREGRKDQVTQKTLVEGSGDLVLHRFTLEHR